MKDQTDVLVVGAGPVGLMLAAELQRRRVDHVVIERNPSPASFAKALGITPRTLEIWDQIGIARDAIDAGLFLRGVGMLVNGTLAEQIDVPETGLPFGSLALAQFETERILRQHLGRLGGRIDAGVALVGFEAGDARVLAHVRDAAGGERTIECAYLVGCDGAHSAVRHGAALDYRGDAYPMTFMLGDVELDWPLPRGYAYRGVHLVEGQVRNGMAAIPIPGNPRRYRVSMAAPEPWAAQDADLATPPDLALLADTIAPMMPPGTALSTLRWSSFFRISHRIVPRYRVGRVFLAGDAAHIHPPIGGQGMNTGLQDAWNLGWKLALAVAGRGAPDLLDSYDAERQPVGLEVVNRTTARMGQAIEGKDHERSDDTLADSQLLVHYRSSRWVSEDVRDGGLAHGPRPGERAPDATGLRQPFVAHAIRLREVLRGPGHTVLLYADQSAGAEQYRAFARLADDLAQRYPGEVSTYAIAAPQSHPVNLERFPLLFDAEGTFRAAYDARGPCLYAIRPDGYVGYRAAPVDPAGLDRYLSRVMAASR